MVEVQSFIKLHTHKHKTIFFKLSLFCVIWLASSKSVTKHFLFKKAVHTFYLYHRIIFSKRQVIIICGNITFKAISVTLLQYIKYSKNGYSCINLTNVISFHHAYPHASTFRVIWSSWSPRLASQHRQRITCASSAITLFRCNLYFHRCSPEFSPFRPSSDSSSSSSHNAQNSHHEDKPKGTKAIFQKHY